MKRLSTPWSVASIRARQIDPMALPAGIILDAAAGSGIQLIAFSKILKRPALGVEIDQDVAKLCAANMFLNWREMSNVLSTESWWEMVVLLNLQFQHTGLV